MSSPAPLRIIIVGGRFSNPLHIELLLTSFSAAGIAGLAAARGLREHDVIVLEQSRMKSELGAAIHLGPNASKIALRWGMDLVKLNSPECNVYKEFTQDGVPQINAKVDTRAEFGAPWLLNHRVDLHNELRRLAESTLPPGRPANIRSAARVVSIVRLDVSLGDIQLTSRFHRTATVELLLLKGAKPCTGT